MGHSKYLTILMIGIRIGSQFTVPTLCPWTAEKYCQDFKTRTAKIIIPNPMTSSITVHINLQNRYLKTATR